MTEPAGPTPRDKALEQAPGPQSGRGRMGGLTDDRGTGKPTPAQVQYAQRLLESAKAPESPEDRLTPDQRTDLLIQRVEANPAFADTLSSVQRIAIGQRKRDLQQALRLLDSAKRPETNTGLGV